MTSPNGRSFLGLEQRGITNLTRRNSCFFGFGRKFNLRVLGTYTSDKVSLDLGIREAEGGKREVDKNG